MINIRVVISSSGDLDRMECPVNISEPQVFFVLNRKILSSVYYSDFSVKNIIFFP